MQIKSKMRYHSTHFRRVKKKKKLAIPHSMKDVEHLELLDIAGDNAKLYNQFGK